MGHLLSEPLSGRVAWALIHFLWQGAAIAAVLAMVLRTRWIGTPQRCYALCVASLVLMALCPLATTLEHRLQPAVIASSGRLKAGLQPAGLQSQQSIIDLPSEISMNTVDAWQPYLLTAWMAGVLLLACRLLAGYCGTLWLRGGRRPLAADLSQRLIDRLGASAVAKVYASPRVHEALVVGFWRPIVLVPLAWLAELPPDVLEAVIAHELAHLRRWDRWIVLFQRIVETLLFYHPAVWWVSRRISLERELCCDELAVLTTGRRLAYARALETVGRRCLREVPLLLATSFHGEAQMNLLNRVRNVLGLGSPREAGLAWPAGVLALTLTAGMLWWSLPSVSAADEPAEKPKLAREGEARKEGEQEKRKSPEAEATRRKSAEAAPGARRSAEGEAGARRSAEAEAGARRSPEAEAVKRKVVERVEDVREERKDVREANPLGDFRPQTDREAALFKLIVMLREEVAQLRQEVVQMRKGGDAGKTIRPRDGDAAVKPGARDGDAPKKPGAKDGEVRKPGPRDGDGAVKPGPRDGDAPKKGPREGDAPKKPGPRDGDKAP